MFTLNHVVFDAAKLQGHSKVLDTFLEDETASIDFPKLTRFGVREFHSFVMGKPEKKTDEELSLCIHAAHFLDASRWFKSLVMEIKTGPYPSREEHIAFLDATGARPFRLSMKNVHRLVDLWTRFMVFQHPAIFQELQKLFPVRDLFYSHGRMYQSLRHRVAGVDTPDFMKMSVGVTDTEAILCFEESSTGRYGWEVVMDIPWKSSLFSSDGQYIMMMYHDMYRVYHTRTGKLMKRSVATTRYPQIMPGSHLILERRSPDNDMVVLSIETDNFLRIREEEDGHIFASAKYLFVHMDMRLTIYDAESMTHVLTIPNLDHCTKGGRVEDSFVFQYDEKKDWFAYSMDGTPIKGTQAEQLIKKFQIQEKRNNTRIISFLPKKCVR